MWNKPKPDAGLSNVWAMLLYWTHWFLRVECCTAQHFTFLNKKLSLGLSFIIKATSAFMAPGTADSPLGSCVTSQCKNPWAVIVPCCLVYHKHLYWYRVEMQLHHVYWGGNSTWLWSGAQHGTSVLESHHLEPFLLLQRGDLSAVTLHHYPEQHTLFEYQDAFCLTNCMLCWSYLLSHAASQNTL